MGRPTGWWSGPPHICSAGAAAASAARIGCRSGSTAYAAARAAAAPAAAPAARRRTADRTALLRAGAGTGAGGIRGRRAADRAVRLSAAGIAAPLPNKVRERKAAEAAVAGRSHSVFLQKKIWERPFPCHSMPHVPEPCRKTAKPGRQEPSGNRMQKSKENSALGELRRTASCLQAVLLSALRVKTVDFTGFFRFSRLG